VSGTYKLITLGILVASPFATAGPGLYDVRYSGNTLTATPRPGAAAQTEEIRVIESTNCDYKIMGKSRIELQGPCGYLGALYHYAPKADGPASQVTGGFAFSRRDRGHVLEVAQAMEIYSQPQVITSPVPPAYLETPQPAR